MNIPVEIMLRQNPEVFTRHVEHPGDPRHWAVEDVRAVLKAILAAVNGVQHPDGASTGVPVTLRGLSWIVSPYQDGVVIAFEIHSASVVAGPFHVDEQLLGNLVAGAVAAERADTVH